MTGKEADSPSNSIEKILDKVYPLLLEGRFKDLDELLDQAHKLDFDNQEIIMLLKITAFWRPSFEELDYYPNPGEKGEFLFEEWLTFYSRIVIKFGKLYEKWQSAVNNLVFSQAEAFFREADAQKSTAGYLWLQRGRCLKGLGDYEAAVKFFKKGLKEKKDDPELLSELADSFALLQEERTAKVFFREAFFLDPQKALSPFLESVLIQELISRVKELGLEKAFLAEWLPVYGVLWGLLNIKRELSGLEVTQLEQSILAMKIQLDRVKDEEEGGLLVPRLIYRYFWLIDHYRSQRKQDKVMEALTNIKELDRKIFQEYTD